MKDSSSEPRPGCKQPLSVAQPFGDHGTIAFVTLGVDAGAVLDAMGLGFRGQTIRILAEVQAE
jgi:hypothetical protein